MGFGAIAGKIMAKLGASTNFGNRIVNTLEQKANNVLERNKEGVNRTENAIASANRMVNTIANEPKKSNTRGWGYA